MGGKRASKQELAQLETLTREGLTCREIGQKLGRSTVAIRNLRYKKHLVARAEDETKALFQQRDELNKIVKNLQGEKRVPDFKLDYLKTEKERLEATIQTDRGLLQETLIQGLINLKQQRPDLFTLSGPEQIAMLLKVFLKWFLTWLWTQLRDYLLINKDSQIAFSEFMLMQKRTIAFLMILVLGVMVSLANATDYLDTGIPAGHMDTMTIDLQDGQRVSGSFNITGSGHQVKFWIRDPTGAIILDSGTVISPVNFEFTASKGGTYVLNFDNSEWSYAKHVYLGYDVSAPPVLGLDPMVFIGLIVVIGIVLAILAFVFHRRSQTRREVTQSPPPPPAPQ